MMLLNSFICKKDFLNNLDLFNMGFVVCVCVWLNTGDIWMLQDSQGFICPCNNF